MAKRKKKTKINVRKNTLKNLPVVRQYSLFASIIIYCLIIGLVFSASWYVSAQHTHRNVIRKIQNAPSFEQLYRDAFVTKNFSALWEIYAPSYQEQIQNSVGKDAYLSFLQKKFAGVRVNHVAFGDCQPGKTVFPYGVEQNYASTCIIPVTLNLYSSSNIIAAQLPAMSQLPLVLVKFGNKQLIVGGGPTDLQAPVLFPSHIVHTTQVVPVVMYHRIAPMPSRTDFLTDYGYRLDVGLTVTTDNFAAQMDQLENLGYHPITPNDLFNNMYYQLPLPSKPVLLTFDDGRLSDFTNGLPILLQHHFTATFFIPPYLTGKMFGYHNHNKYMNFDQLKTLTQDGMFVENHSLKHDKPLWDIPPQELLSQLTTANQDLTSYTQYPIQFIAYPGRWPSNDWQHTTPAENTTISVLSHMGFAMSFLDLGQNRIIEDSNYPYQTPRIRPENVPELAFLLESSPSAAIARK